MKKYFVPNLKKRERWGERERGREHRHPELVSGSLCKCGS